MRKRSTYAKLLEPGQKFWTKGDGRVYTVSEVSVTKVRDTSTVSLGDRVAGPMGTLIMVKIHVEGRSRPLVFDGSDRVELR